MQSKRSMGSTHGSCVKGCTLHGKLEFVGGGEGPLSHG